MSYYHSGFTAVQRWTEAQQKTVDGGRLAGLSISQKCWRRFSRRRYVCEGHMRETAISILLFWSPRWSVSEEVHSRKMSKTLCCKGEKLVTPAHQTCCVSLSHISAPKIKTLTEAHSLRCDVQYTSIGRIS